MPLLEVKFQPHISPGECIQANMRVARDASAKALGVNIDTIAVEATPFSEHRIGTADEEFTLRASGSLVITGANMLDARPEKTFIRSKYTPGTIEQAAHKVTDECLLLYTQASIPRKLDRGDGRYGQLLSRIAIGWTTIAEPWAYREITTHLS